jgi:hypothetical protein
MRLSLCLAVVAGAAIASVAAASGEPDWQPLYDGKSLDGWVQRGGAATYRVADGVIVGTTGAGEANTFLCTEREFADFILEYDFKVDPRLNSGVQIRSQSVPGYQNGRVHGYQVEIDPSERAYTGGIYDEARRGWLCDLSKNEAARKAFKQGEWNHVRVEARGDSLKTWLNGVPAADLKDGLTHSGFIGLQVHATKEKEPLEVRWRNLRIKDLGDPWGTPPADAVVLLGNEGDLSAWKRASSGFCEASGPESVQWMLVEGVLEVKPGSGSIVTRRAFGDCRLHVEFCVDDNGQADQNNGNSGVYLQRRYEIQILNSAGKDPADDICGAIYKMKAPDYNVARPAGQWQTYDIFFRAPQWERGMKTQSANITVYHNGTRVQDHVVVPSSTGAGQPEGPADGPLLLQDHGSKNKFRNIWIAPLSAEAKP